MDKHPDPMLSHVLISNEILSVPSLDGTKFFIRKSSTSQWGMIHSEFPHMTIKEYEEKYVINNIFVGKKISKL